MIRHKMQVRNTYLVRVWCDVKSKANPTKSTPLKTPTEMLTCSQIDISPPRMRRNNNLR
jgi:hypothetical protein